MLDKLPKLIQNLSMTQVYLYAGPVGAPLPSAFALGMNLYDYMVKAYPAHPTAAAVAAWGGVIGIESTGALSAVLVSRAYVNQDKKTAIGALLVLLAYIVFVVIGIYTGQDSGSMVATVLITLLCYVVQALWNGLSEKKSLDAQVQNAETTSLTLQAQIAEANASKARAEARAAKASSGRPPLPGGHLAASGGQLAASGGQARTVSLDPDKLAAVLAYLKTQPNPKSVSLRELEAATLGLKKSAVAPYKAAALDLLKSESQGVTP